MKKIGTYILIILLSLIIFLLGFSYDSTIEPNTYYQVYLDGEYIGMIESKKELENYINKQGEIIRKNVLTYKDSINTIDMVDMIFEKYNLSNLTNKEKVKKLLKNSKQYDLSSVEKEYLEDYNKSKYYNLSLQDIKEMEDYTDTNSIYLSIQNVYAPNGIEIKKVNTYNNSITSIKNVYKEIMSKKSCTIAGYKFTINKEEDKEIIVYTTDTDIFSNAIDSLAKVFIDEEEYNNYKKDNQNIIETTGSIIENVYVDEEITYKAINIPIEEKIYTTQKDLEMFLLYGDNYEERKVTVKEGNSIESLTFDNQISVQEFLIFNKGYNSINNLLVPGSEVIISKVNPQISIVKETYEVVDKQTEFDTVETYDSNLTQGSMVVTQNGENGLERVAQNVKYINGEITYVNPVSKEVLKHPVSKVISIGTKYIPSVGSTISWGWPTNSGYTFSSYYGYRLAVFGEGNFHSGIDIAGTGYGSNVYAANNGVIEKMTYTNSYGYYIMINHNNGYYTLYAHMSGFAGGISVGSTVARGQVIGYVGSSGWATGPHLHYEIRTCAAFSCVTNPLGYY